MSPNNQTFIYPELHTFPQPQYYPSQSQYYPSQSQYYPSQPQYYPSQPQLTQIIHGQTSQLLSEAKNLSDSILCRQIKPHPAYNPELSQTSRASEAKGSTTYIDFSDRSWKMFNSETHYHHHSENKSKNDARDRILVGLIALVVIGVTTFFIGKTMANNEEKQEEKENFEDLKNQWKVNKVCYHLNYQNAVDEVIKKTDSILKRQQTYRTHQFILLFFGLTAGGIAFGGAVVGSSALMLTAALVGGVVGGLTMFKLGYSYFSKRDQKEALLIERKLNEITQTPVFVESY